MRIGIDAYSVGLIAVVSWIGGVRGTDLLAVVLVYATTIAIITWITARTVGSLNHNVNFRHAIATLNGAIDGDDPDHATTNADDIQDMIRRGLPLVSDIIPADRVAVFAYNGRTGRFTNLGTWPDLRDAAPDLASLPELTRGPPDRRASSSPPPTASSPSGTAPTASWSWWCPGTDTGGSAQQRTDEGAALIAAAFLRVTSRANFVSGLQAESRTDPLTGLANRRTLYERIEIEMEHALRSDTPLTVAMVDLDHFKQLQRPVRSRGRGHAAALHRRADGVQHQGPGPGGALRRRGVLPGPARDRHPGRATTSSTSSGRAVATPPPTSASPSRPA